MLINNYSLKNGCFSRYCFTDEELNPYLMASVLKQRSEYDLIIRADTRKLPVNLHSPNYSPRLLWLHMCTFYSLSLTTRSIKCVHQSNTYTNLSIMLRIVMWDLSSNKGLLFLHDSCKANHLNLAFWHETGPCSIIMVTTQSHSSVYKIYTHWILLKHK